MVGGMRNTEDIQRSVCEREGRAPHLDLDAADAVIDAVRDVEVHARHGDEARVVGVALPDARGALEERVRDDGEGGLELLVWRWVVGWLVCWVVGVLGFRNRRRSFIKRARTLTKKSSCWICFTWGDMHQSVGKKIGEGVAGVKGQGRSNQTRQTPHPKHAQAYTEWAFWKATGMKSRDPPCKSMPGTRPFSVCAYV